MFHQLEPEKFASDGW